MAKNKEYSITNLQLCFLKHYDSDTHFINDHPVMEDTFSDGLVAICEKVCDHFKQVSTGDIYFVYDLCPTVGDFFVWACKPLINIVKPDKLLNLMEKKFTKEEITKIEKVLVEKYVRQKINAIRKAEEEKYYEEIQKEIKESRERILNMTPEEQAEELKKYSDFEKFDEIGPSNFKPGWDRDSDINKLFQDWQKKHNNKTEEILRDSSKEDKDNRRNKGENEGKDNGKDDDLTL